MTEEELATSEYVVSEAKRMLDEIKQIETAMTKLRSAKKSFSDFNTGESLLSADLLDRVLLHGMRVVTNGCKEGVAEMIPAQLRGRAKL